MLKKLACHVFINIIFFGDSLTAGHGLRASQWEGENIKIRFLSAAWKDLVRDQERALEFDQSHLFRKVYNEEFGTPGGEPYSLLIGDYDIRPRPSAEHPIDDLGALQGIAGVAAAAFAPFIAGAHPTLLELNSFPDMESLASVGRHFTQLEYLKWKTFREAEDSRFVGLALPRIVMRAPYGDDLQREDGFRFREDVSAADRGGYLWGNAAFAFGAVAIRAFAETSWLADVRGVRRGEIGGGVVAGLPACGFSVGRGGGARSVTDAHVTDFQEKELTDLGFMPLCHCPDTELAAFYGTPSVQKPRMYDEPAATANARLSSMLHYTLCISRFAHYIKVMVRDRIGAFTSPAECEDRLRKWLQGYIVSNDDAAPDMKARYPLREAKVQVRELPGKPGTYSATIHLRPHFQLDQLSAGIKLTTELISRDNE